VTTSNYEVEIDSASPNYSLLFIAQTVLILSWPRDFESLINKINNLDENVQTTVLFK
jgi:hypothetical protein